MRSGVPREGCIPSFSVPTYDQLFAAAMCCQGPRIPESLIDYLSDVLKLKKLCSVTHLFSASRTKKGPQRDTLTTEIGKQALITVLAFVEEWQPFSHFKRQSQLDICAALNVPSCFKYCLNYVQDELSRLVWMLQYGNADTFKEGYSPEYLPFLYPILRQLARVERAVQNIYPTSSPYNENGCYILVEGGERSFPLFSSLEDPAHVLASIECPVQPRLVCKNLREWNNKNDSTGEDVPEEVRVVTCAVCLKILCEDDSFPLQPMCEDIYCIPCMKTSDVWTKR